MQDTAMAAPAPSNNSDDYFYPGSIVKCTSCHDDVFQGEVLAFDHETKILMLKQPATGGKPDQNNVCMLNMEWIKNVEVVKDLTDSPITPLSSLNQSKLLKRYKSEFDMKMMLTSALKAGFSREGLQLYLYVKKVIDECSLVEQNINVMDEVLIKPPYKAENCQEKSSASSKQCLEYVQGIVEKFHKEERLKTQTKGKETT